MDQDQVVQQLQQEIQQLKQTMKNQTTKFEEQKKLWDETKQQQLSTIKKQNEELVAAKEQQKQQLDKFTEQQEIQAEQTRQMQKLLDLQQEHQNRLPILQSANNKLSNEFLQLEQTNHQLENNLDDLKHENQRLKLIEQQYLQQKQTIQTQLQQIHRMESVIKKLNHERNLYEVAVNKLHRENQTLKTDNEYFKTMRENTQLEYLNLSQLQNQRLTQNFGPLKLKSRGNSTIFANKDQQQVQNNSTDTTINLDQEQQLPVNDSQLNIPKPTYVVKHETIDKGVQTVQPLESSEASQNVKQTPQKKWRKVVEKAQKTAEQQIREEKELNIVQEITSTLKQSNLIASSGVVDIALKSFRSDEIEFPSQLAISPNLQINSNNMSSYIDLVCLNVNNEKLKRDRCIDILAKIEAEPSKPFVLMNVTKHRLYQLFKILKLRNNGFVKLRGDFDLDESMYDILTKIQAGEQIPSLSDEQLKMLDKVTQPEYSKYLSALGFKINSDYVHSRFGFPGDAKQYQHLNIPDVIEIEGEEPLILDQQMKHILYQLQNNKEIDIELKPGRYEQLKKLVQVSNETLSKQLGFYIGLDTQQQLKHALEQVV